MLELYMFFIVIIEYNNYNIMGVDNILLGLSFILKF